MAPDSHPTLPFDALDLAAGEVERNLRWGREQGHPRYVWPDVPLRHWQACRRAVGEAVSAVLAGSDAPVRLSLPDGAPTRALGVAAFTSGVGPLLGRWIEDGRMVAEPDVSALLELHLRHGRRRARDMAALLDSTAHLLAREAIPVVALKGAHTGVAFFPEPGARPASDVDLLVPPTRFADADRILTEAGYRGGPRKAEPLTREWTPPGESRRVRSLELTHADNPLEVDLHGSLDRDFFRVETIRLGWPTEDDREPFPGNANGPAEVLAEPVLTAFLSAHASHGLRNLTLLRVVELVLVIRHGRSTGALSWEALERRLAHAGGLRFVLPAFGLVDELAPGTVDPEFLSRMRDASPPRMRKIVASLDPGSAPMLDRVPVERRMMWGSSPMDHLRRFHDFMWPRSEGDSWRRRLGVWRDRLAVLLRGKVR